MDEEEQQQQLWDSTNNSNSQIVFSLFSGKNDSQLNVGVSIGNQSGANLDNLSLLSQSLVSSIEHLNEFSYFKSDKLKLWMGPDRWKPTTFGANRPNAQVKEHQSLLSVKV